MRLEPGQPTRSIAAVLAALLGLSVAGAAFAAAEGKVIGRGVRLKTSRVFFAQGTSIAPKTVSVTVVPTPAQPVKVQWSLVCQKPNKADPAIQIAANERSGTTTVRGTGTVKLAFPFAKPPTCVASVYATLAGKGRLVLHLVQT